MSSRGKSIWAVIAGLLTVIIGTTIVDIVLHKAGVYPPMGQAMGDGLSAMATSYRIVISVLGAYLTASLAPVKPMKHALILGGIGIVLGSLGVVMAMTVAKDMAPMWYPIGLVVLAVPQCWLGGWLFERRQA